MPWWWSTFVSVLLLTAPLTVTGCAVSSDPSTHSDNVTPSTSWITCSIAEDIQIGDVACSYTLTESTGSFVSKFDDKCADCLTSESIPVDDSTMTVQWRVTSDKFAQLLGQDPSVSVLTVNTGCNKTNANDSTGPSIFIVQIQPVNTEPPVFSATEYVYNISESFPVDVWIDSIITGESGAITANPIIALDPDGPPDSGDSIVTFTIGSAGQEYFNLYRTSKPVNGDSSPENPRLQYEGHLALKKKLNYEDHSSITFTVEAIDQGTPARTSTATITINVKDEDDRDPIFSQSVYTTEVTAEMIQNEEKQTLTVTPGPIHAYDQDTGRDDPVMYELDFTKCGFEGKCEMLYSSFSLEADGQNQILTFMKTGNAEDYPDGTVTFVITSYLPSAPLKKAYAKLLVKISNKGFRVEKSVYNVTVMDTGSAGDHVLTVSVTPVTEVKYTIAGCENEPEPDVFSIEESTGKISLKKNLTSESLKSSYCLLVTATSAGRPDLSDTTQVYIETVSSCLTLTLMKQFYPITVEEEQPKGVLVAQIEAYDLPGEFHFASGNDEDVSDKFEIDATGKITTLKELDYEDTRYYEFIVEFGAPVSRRCIQDTGLPPNQAVVLVNVTDINDNKPQFVNARSEDGVLHVGVSSAAYPTLDVISLMATDDDEVDNEIFYEIKSGGEDLYTVNKDTGLLKQTRLQTPNTRFFRRRRAAAADVTVTASNPGVETEPSELNVRVHLLRDDEIIVLKSKEKPTDLNAQLDELLRNLSSITQFDIRALKLESDSGSGVNLYLYAFATTNSRTPTVETVPVNQLKEALIAHQADVESLFGESTEIIEFVPQKSSSDGGDDRVPKTYRNATIGLGVVLAVVILLGAYGLFHVMRSRKKTQTVMDNFGRRSSKPYENLPSDGDGAVLCEQLKRVSTEFKSGGKKGPQEGKGYVNPTLNLDSEKPPSKPKQLRKPKEELERENNNHYHQVDRQKSAGTSGGKPVAVVIATDRNGSQERNNLSEESRETSTNAGKKLEITPLVRSRSVPGTALPPPQPSRVSRFTVSVVPDSDVAGELIMPTIKPIKAQIDLPAPESCKVTSVSIVLEQPVEPGSSEPEQAEEKSAQVEERLPHVEEKNPVQTPESSVGIDLKRMSAISESSEPPTDLNVRALDEEIRSPSSTGVPCLGTVTIVESPPEVQTSSDAAKASDFRDEINAALLESPPSPHPGAGPRRKSILVDPSTRDGTRQRKKSAVFPGMRRRSIVTFSDKAQVITMSPT